MSPEIRANDILLLARCLQEKLNAALTHEQEKNAGNLAEIDSLQQSYTEQLAAFEASPEKLHLPWLVADDFLFLSQEVKKYADGLTKTAKKMEKEEVGLSEKKKHLVGKRKKMEKAIKDVSIAARHKQSGSRLTDDSHRMAMHDLRPCRPLRAARTS